jgi:hypothetical protein
MPSFDCYFCKSKIDCLYETINCFYCQCLNSQTFMHSKIKTIMLFLNPYSMNINFINNESSIYYANHDGIKKIYHVNSIINITPNNIKSKLPTILALI